ncbi:Saccharopepsin [Dactylellina cionopaga]|nr:Saccharopepsin [Dactylellina cionopaga]
MRDLTIQNQLLPEVTKMPSARVSYDGVLGLGWDTHSVNGIPPPFYKMLNQELLDEEVFAFRFSTNGFDGSEITFDGINEDAYIGHIQWFPLRREGSWEISFDSILVGDDLTKVGDTGAIPDTSTAWIMLLVQ